MFMKNWLVVSSVVLVMSSAQAQNYVGLELGSAYPDLDGMISDNKSFIEDETGNPVSTSKDKTVPAFRIFGGKAANQNLDIELGYLSTGDMRVTYRGVDAGDDLRWTQDFSASGFDLAAVYKPFEKGFFIKAGMHATRGKVKIKLYENGLLDGVESDSASGTGLLMGVGYEAPVSKGVNLRGSYVRYQRMAGESDYDLDMVTLGLTKQF
jgi:hypothetical protein